MLRSLLTSILFVGAVLAQGGPAYHLGSGPHLPAKCSPKSGDVFVLTTGTTGVQYNCTATNTWTQVGRAGATLIDILCLGMISVGGCNMDLPAASVVTTGTTAAGSVNLGYAIFPGSATGTQAVIEFHRQLPLTWTSVSFDLSWFTSATTGAAVWNLQLACISAASPNLSPTGDTARAYSSTANASASALTVLATQTVTLPTGCVAGTPSPILVGWLYRNGTDSLGSSAAANLLTARLTIQ